jgi:uncharacterized protein (DUF433 family)
MESGIEACYGRSMEPCDEDGVCSGEPPAIARRGPRGDAWLVGTPLYVWQVVEALERRGSTAAVARETGLAERQVRLALEFYDRAPDEIDARLAERRAPVEPASPAPRARPELATLDDGATPVHRWLRRQLRQPLEFRERLEAATASDDPAEVRRLLERVPFTPAQRRHLDDLLERWTQHPLE